MNMNRGYSILPASYPIQLCAYCQNKCEGPLSVLPCNCRVPVHPTCFAPFLLTRQQCLQCQTHWNLFPPSSASSTVSVPITQIGSTEIRYSAPNHCFLYGFIVVLVILLVIFILMYVYKQ